MILWCGIMGMLALVLAALEMWSGLASVLLAGVLGALGMWWEGP